MSKLGSAIDRDPGREMVSLSRMLFARCSEDPDATAFYFAGETWTRGRLAVVVERLARWFLVLGLKPGDRVALHLNNGPEAAICYFACFATGAIAAPLRPAWKSAELSALLQRLKPSLYIGHRDLVRRIADFDPAVLPLTRRVIVNNWEDLQAWPMDQAHEAPELPSIDLREPAILLGTSGTTAQPKFVTHTQSTLWHAIRPTSGGIPSVELKLAISSPMTHVSGFLSTVSCLARGLEFVLLERFDPDEILDTIERYRSTHVMGMPYMFGQLIERQKLRRRDVSSVTHFLSTGDVVPIEVQRAFRQVFGVRLHSGYGSTEATTSLASGPVDGPVCTALPGVETRLCDEFGADVAPGEPGELLLRGPHITTGYWQSPGHVINDTSDGWFHTGDLMRQDENGNFWYVSRKQFMIIRAGTNISPVEVELALASHPAVQDAAVTGVQDEVLGQRVHGLVQLKPDAGKIDTAAILAHVSSQLADHKVPETIKFVASIPRNALGKIDRRAISAIV
jgi:long-chain acyl-CoA synthetase